MRAVWVVLTGSILLGGCGGGKLPEGDRSSAEDPAEAPAESPHAGGAPIASQLGASGPTDDHALPLKLTGLNSVEELEDGKRAVQSDEARAIFESGFRKTFTADAAKRDYGGSVSDLTQVLQKEPACAHAHRALGYAKFNMGFNVTGALESYHKAVELKPDYGEAHYALAFMYAMNDIETGSVHFKKSQELGIEDERNLKERFYSEN